MRRVRRFLALDAARRGAFLWSLALLPVAAAVARWRGFAAAQSIVARVSAPCADAMAPDAAAGMVDAAAALLGASCVPRSLVLWRLMRSRGATVRLGVARSHARGFAAHAWVELDGRALNDAPGLVAQFAAFPAHARVSGPLARDR